MDHQKAKIRNRYNQGPHLTQDTIWESDKTQENITYKRAKRSVFSQQVTTRLKETDMTVWQRQTQIKKKDPLNKLRLGTVNKNNTGGLKQVSQYQFILTFDNVDQDT